MGRTSIKNELILSFLALLLIVMVGVSIVNRVLNDFYLAMSISTAFALIAGIIFGGIFSKSLVSRLIRLGNITKQISKGDLSKDIQLLSSDEIRDLEEAFSTMLNDLRKMILEMKTVSFEIQKTNTYLYEMVKKVLANSQEIDQSAKAIAKGSEDQTLIVQKTSLRLENGINEMDEMIKQSAETISKINEARIKTEKTEANVRWTFNHLEEVLKQMVTYTQPTYRLSAKVEKINLFISIMDNIAQKTDLLSLNASIEATRAGELGKGFALVADEIRSMAESSKQSSGEIRKMVEDILDDNKAVIDALDQTQKGISEGRETIYNTLDMVGEMLGGVKGIHSEVKFIEEVMAKQVQQLKGLSSHFQDLSRLAAENFVSTQKTSVALKNQKQEILQIGNAMKSLNSLSEKLIETQQRFKLGEYLSS